MTKYLLILALFVLHWGLLPLPHSQATNSAAICTTLSGTLPVGTHTLGPIPHPFGSTLAVEVTASNAAGTSLRVNLSTKVFSEDTSHPFRVSLSNKAEENTNPSLTLINNTGVDATYLITVTCSSSLDPNGDADNDGVLNAADNCPTVANPGQEDGWGSGAGDACDTSLYDSGNGVKIFFQTRRGSQAGVYDIYAACGAKGDGNKCYRIATLNPARLTQAAGPQKLNPTSEAFGWRAEVYFLGESNNERSYQVNVYDSGGALRDDRFLLLVKSDGSTTWRKR
jgi:hypothetical protein